MNKSMKQWDTVSVIVVTAMLTLILVFLTKKPCYCNDNLSAAPYDYTSENVSDYIDDSFMRLDNE